MTIDAQLEAVLFFKGEPVSIKRLSELLKKPSSDIEIGLKTLEEKLTGRGLTLIWKDDTLEKQSAGERHRDAEKQGSAEKQGNQLNPRTEVMLGTAPEMGKIIEDLTREELTRDLGKAGLETLSIVLYRGPISRREIDYIRGVNSTFILRNLLIRGLVEKVQSPSDQRAFLYRPTFELLGFMGLNRIEDLPEYAALRAEVEHFEQAAKETEQAGDTDKIGGTGQTGENHNNDNKQKNENPIS